jgi:hypothetical protein
MAIASGDRTIQAAIDAGHCTADVVSVRIRKIGDSLQDRNLNTPEK